MSTLTYDIHCQYSGVLIGKLDYLVVAGHMPYLSHWDKMTAMHPIFSFPRHKLLGFVRGEWNRLAKASTDGETTAVENQLLQIGFLAVLHSLDSIQQQCPSLPPLHVVQSNMSRLFALAFWYHYLESERFKFPRFRIHKANQNTSFENIQDYLDLCFEKKDSYESEVTELQEKEKIDAAERALKALRNSWVTPVGNKALWRWVRAHLPAKYEADAQGWMSTIFMGNERTILDFDKDEIQLMTDIIVSECPPGTGILTAVRARLDKILQIYSDNKEAFDIDFDDYDDDAPLAALRAASAAPESTAPPRASDFATKTEYIRANALYYLQQRAAQKRTDSAANSL